MFKSKIILLIVSIIIAGCNASLTQNMDNIEIEKQIDIRSLNSNEKYDKDIIQAADEATMILGEKSRYTGYNLIEVNGYQVLFKPEEPNTLLIYQNGRLLSDYVENKTTLYDDDTYFPYVSHQSVYYDNKKEVIHYNDGSKYFKDYGLNGIDGIFKIESFGDKTTDALIGGGLSTKKLLYQDRACKIQLPAQVIACCIVEGKEKLLQLGDSGWESREPDDKFSCD